MTLIGWFVRLPYQFRNLMELINLIASYKQADEQVEVKLITREEEVNEDLREDVKERLKMVQDNLEPVGVDFYFEYDDFIHDRYILVDDRWKITLGRGLDIWNKTNGYFDIAETNQLYRSCKGFSMTIVKT